MGWAKERRLPGDILLRGKDWTDEIKKSTGGGVVAVLSLEFSNGSCSNKKRYYVGPSNPQSLNLRLLQAKVFKN